MKNIALIDPSLNANDHLIANNIGDEIIYHYIVANFLSNYKDVSVKRFSAHRSLDPTELQEIKLADLVFFGGTNIVSMDVCHNSRWIPKQGRFYYFFPGIKNLIFLGVGMNGYTDPQAINFKCKLRTELFYKNLLSHSYYHAVRDHQTLEFLKSIGIKNVLFTSCPTLWGICESLNLNIEERTTKCVFSLTDYDQDPKRDNEFMRILLQNFQSLVFFPQGKNDQAYIESLEMYAGNKENIEILPRDLNYLEEYAGKEKFTYIGTRLHLGIFFLNKNIKSLIIGIDNRALEMKKSANLPVIPSHSLNLIEDWVNGDLLFTQLNIPFENIRKWKEQF